MKASKRPIYRKYPLSNPQRGIHFSEFSSGKLAVNNICVAYFLEKPFTIDELSYAFNQAYISYPTLRMRITREGSTAQQYLVPYSTVDYNEYLHFHNKKEFDQWLSLLVTEKVRYWDSPLADFFPFQQEDGNRGFVFRTHHIWIPFTSRFTKD